MKLASNLVHLALVGTGSAHMLMSYPPSLKYKGNPFSGSQVDSDLTSPLSADGSNFPCKGSLNLLGTSAGQPVASWTGGQQYNMTISGGAPHGGGSCQASISTDNGATFRVIHSYVGQCPSPSGGDSSFNFKVPSDTPAGTALFAWTWFNQVGNREMYMNCAVVNIAGGSGSESTSFKDRPTIFEANIAPSKCTTADSKDLKFPDPGPDVDIKNPDAADPVGDCPAVSSSSGSSTGTPASASDSGSSSSSESSPDSSGSNSNPGLFVTTSYAAATPTSSTSGGDGSDGDSNPKPASTYVPGAFTPGDNWPVWYSSANRLTCVCWSGFLAVILAGMV